MNAIVQDIEEPLGVGKRAVLLFWATWHEGSIPGGPMDQILQALAATSSFSRASSSSNNNNGDDTDVVFGRVNAEKVPSLTSQYGVTAVPSFVLLSSSGQVVQLLQVSGTTDDIARVTQAVQSFLLNPTTTAATEAAATPTTTTTGASPEEQLTQRLKQLIRTSEVMLFMKGSPTAPRCGFSRQAVELLQEGHITFGSFDILSDESVRQGLKKLSDWPTYPQLYVKGELIGGLDIMKEMKSDTLSGSFADQLGVSSSSPQEPESLSLNQRLEQLINRSPIMLFMKGVPSAPRCGFSRYMVEMLDSMSIPYDTFNILEDEEVRQGLKTYSDWPTYPQLYNKGELVGGLDICKELMESGELQEMLK